MNYSSKQIAQIVGAEHLGMEIPEIDSTFIDSRLRDYSSCSCFFALSGKNHDANNFIPELINSGVRCFVVQKSLPEYLNSNVCVLKVDNVLNAFQKLSAHYRGLFQFPIISITGSNGKTIVKEWLSHLLEEDFRLVKNPKSFNSQVGVPLSVQLLNDKANLGIFEVGISKRGEMACLESILKPNIGVFTNIGEAHQENFDSIEEKLEEKLLLFQSCEEIIYSQDQKLVHEKITELYPNKKHISWSLKDQMAEYFVKTSIHPDGKQTQIQIHQGKNSMESFLIPFTERMSIENALNALVCAIHLGGEIERLKVRCYNLHALSMRMEMREGILQSSILNDFYNSDLASLKISLEYLRNQSGGKDCVLILSDILQSGKVQQELYKEVAELISIYKIKQFVGIGENLFAHKSFFPANSNFYTKTQDFIENFRKDDFRNKAILLKGAREFRFEEISPLLEKKTHTTMLEVNLDALAHNFNFFKSLLKPKVKQMVMVKAFSYGSGSYEIASLLQFLNADYLGVAYTDEGIQLRQSGIHIPIMVMNPSENSFDQLIEHNLEPEIFSFEILKEFMKACKRHAVDQYPIHLKLDTGMHRLGFMKNEIQELIDILRTDKLLKVQSVFSHLAGSDSSDFDAYTQSQINDFKLATDKIREALSYDFIRHILNSSGIERFPAAQFDMVRLGIGLYGIGTIYKEEVKTVSSFKTYISQVKELKAGQSIGYSRRTILEKDSRIATIPVGYADGYNRLLGNRKASVYINGKHCPILGNVCMDMCMVDVSGLQVQRGDEVELFGKEIDIRDLAAAIETIPYEILTSVSQRVNRVYVKE